MSARILRACAIAVWAVIPVWPQTWTEQSSGTTASLRGLSAVSRKVLWAGGTGGSYLRTVDGGATWRAATVPGAADMDFRAVRALDGKTAWLLSSGPGDKSRIYKTIDEGAHWKLLITNPDGAGFWDALAFWDARRGIVLGDPVDGRFVILTTLDGGESWIRGKTPPALASEGAFAASNSCLTVRGNSEVWFGTGGTAGARVFHSQDAGQTWDVARVPMRNDSAGAGVFSLAFADALHAVAVGGDYAKPAETRGNVAISSDDGRSWLEPTGTHPNGYRSAVAYLAGRQVWIAVGTSGSDISRDGGRSWRPFDKVAYNALTVSADAVWAAGPQGRIAFLELK